MRMLLNMGMIIIATLAVVPTERAHALIAMRKVQDLKKNPVSNKVTAFLKTLAQGNEGEAGVESLELDTYTGLVRGSLFVRHHHEWRWVIRDFFGKEYPQNQTAYDWTWRGTFEFNIKTGDGNVVIDIGQGVKLDTRRIQRILEGDLGAIIELIPSPGVTKEFRNEYDHIRRSYEERYGRDNVYFASSRFVDWATPETAGKWVAAAIVSGGASSGSAFREVTKMSMLELNELSQWFQAKGVREAKSVAQAVLSGEKTEWPFLAVKWQTVAYESRTAIIGRPVTPWIPVRHAAFAIIWTSGQSERKPSGPSVNPLPRTLPEIRTGELRPRPLPPGSPTPGASPQTGLKPGPQPLSSAGVTGLKTVFVRNETAVPLDIAVAHVRGGRQVVEGFVRVNPGQRVRIADVESRRFDFHARTLDGKRSWSGPTVHRVQGQAYGFYEMDATKDGREITVGVSFATAR